MSTEDEIARAARKSREWQARKAEIEAAAREDADLARRRRAIIDQVQREHHQVSNIWRNIVFALIAITAGLIFLEQQAISDRAQKCFAGPAIVHQYDCADQITHSIWFWTLPSETRALLKASAGQG